MRVWKRLTEKMGPRDWLLILIAIGVLIVVILGFALRKKPDIAASPALNGIKDTGVVRVGVQTDLTKFAYKAENGQIEGLDVDIARAISARIFDGDTSKVEFVPVTINTRIPKLDKQLVDCSLAIIPAGISTKAAYSRPYYTDAVGVVVRADDPITSADGLAGKRVGVVARPSIAAKAMTCQKAAEEYDKTHRLNLQIVDYTSIPDLLDALGAGKIDACALEYALISAYYTEEFKVLPEAIAKIPYTVAVRAGDETMLELVNDVIKKLEDSGELKAMWDARGLYDYR